MNKKLLVLIVVLALCLTLSAVVMADGDGKGGGNNPLTLTKSNPEDSAKNISVDQEIKLTFSNNVVNMKVDENNKKCFKMTDKSGAEISIDVVMGDDQINKDIKNDIIIKPVNGLEENKTYTITISEKLKSKNGSTLGEPLKITFSTEKTGTSKFALYIAIGCGLLVGFVIVKIKNKTVK